MEFDPDLPITQRLADIGQALRSHQVVVVAGETGSGKTTQLPKLCLQLGRERIAHTQPRRIAARSVAERIAEETGTRLGELVGYQVRFTRKAGRHTRLKVMTDGILLAEINHDRDLRAYDTIIIDEAHERSLNIDFLLGYLKRLVHRRPELKVIITSATIDTARFAAHFDDAPIIEVSGRTHPVEIRYRPLVDPETGKAVDQVDGICAAVNELLAATGGDLLVFLSGEREIRDAADALAGLRLSDTEILPLFSRLSAAEQHRIFQPHSGRRIVLATNVAETSLTVPGIIGVIDTGTARISRYSTRTKVQRLPIEPVSQASANQRAGRCGRVAPGICIRLYSEEDYLARPEFTEPEIMRTNLASVVLQMAEARLGAIEEFPFVEAPDRSRITDGLRLLTELGAIQPPRRGTTMVRLTRVGHRLARIPIDPRLGRMLLAGAEHGCLREILVIVAGLAIQDPRERPAEHQQAVDEAHRRFWAPLGVDDPQPDGSDFMAWYRLWQYVVTQRAELSGNAFRRLCQREFLNFLRIREWQDLHNQLQEITRELGLEERAASGDPDDIHRALLTGLLSNIGRAEARPKPRNAKEARTRGPRQYLGTRGTKFSISPGSAVARTPPELVVAAEIVETSRAWARTVAGVDARWVERAAGNLLTRTHSEPHFSQRSSSVVAHEKTSLWGVPLVADRIVNYASVDPVTARELFLRQGLVEQQWRTRHGFFHRNRALREQVESLADRTRQGVAIDDEALMAFYDKRIPDHVCSGASFDRWWRDHGDDGTLDLTEADLMSTGVDLTGYPDHWMVAGHELPVSYVWSPGDRHDGVTVDVDLELINSLRPEPFTWQVPGLREELVVALLRGLPKALRTQLVPVPDTARAVVAALGEADRSTSLTSAISAVLRHERGVHVGPEDWAAVSLPDHLEVGFRILDADGQEVAHGKDLRHLQATLTERSSARLTELMAPTTSSSEITGAVSWVFDILPDRLTGSGGVLGWPALRDEGATVALAVADSPRRQRFWHRLGLRRLVLLNTPDPTLWVVAHLSNPDKLALQFAPDQRVPDLIADARLAAVGAVTDALVDPMTVRDQSAFQDLCDRARQDIPEQTLGLVGLAARVLRLWSDATREAAALPADAEITTDIRAQLADLVFPGFLTVTPLRHLERLPVYLTAVSRRIESWRSHGEDRDLAAMDQFLAAEQSVSDLVDGFPDGPLPPEVDDVGWLLEELRVSLFAQQLGTRVPVSVKRIRRAAADAPQSWTV